MRKFILFIVGIISLSSCEKQADEYDDGLPYFRFVAADSDNFVSGHELGEIIKFKNQFDEEKFFIFWLNIICNWIC